MVDTALKNQLVSVFEDAYLEKVKNAYTGYATKMTLALLNHLYSNSALHSAMNMVASNEKIRSRYNTEKPLKGLIERLNECADFATAAGKTVTETKIVCIDYRLVPETVK